MKFKATFSERGLRTLERGLLPTLEKFGKSCQLLLGPEDVHFVQNALDTDGTQITARLANVVLFEPDKHRCQSRHNDLIAFSFDIALMLRVLKAAGANDTETVEVKLAMRQVSMGAGVPAQSRPFLSFTCQGSSEALNMVQDLPISKPHSASDIDRLVKEKDIASLCPYYLDLTNEIGRLQAMVDKLRSIDSVLMLATTTAGDLHMQVAADGVSLGAEFQKLRVLPATVAAEARRSTAATAEQRLRDAKEQGDAQSVIVQVKHLARSLHTSLLTKPAQVLCGIPTNSGHVHFMFVYRNPFDEGTYDDNISLSYKLPVRDDS